MSIPVRLSGIRLLSRVPSSSLRVAGVTAALALLAGCAGVPRGASPAELAAATGQPAPPPATCPAEQQAQARKTKPRRVLDALEVPGAYVDAVYGDHRNAEGEVVTRNGRYRVDQRFVTTDSGLSGLTLLDGASGHAVLVLQGVNRWFVDGGGIADALADLGAVLRARGGARNDQQDEALRRYHALLCDERVRTVEVVGYSFGSASANFLAAFESAQAVVFGDMGLPQALLDEADAKGAEAGAALRRGLKARVTSLSLSGDMLVKVMGLGPIVGTVVPLPGGAGGIFHQPEIYRYAGDAALHDRDNAQRRVAAGDGAAPGAPAVP